MRASPADNLPHLLAAARQRTLDGVLARNQRFLEQELAKLDEWATDRKLALRRDLKTFDQDIRELDRAVRNAGSMPEQLAVRRKRSQLELKRDEAEMAFRAAAREVDARTQDLIDNVQATLAQRASTEPLFTIRWRLV